MGLTVWALGKLIHKETFLCVRVCVQVRCYDWDADSSHDLIGEFTTTLGELTTAYQEGRKVSRDVYSFLV